MDKPDYATRYIGKKIKVKIDRQMGSKHPKWGFVYPVNYGFVPDTKAPDGGEVDAYVLGVFKPVTEFEGVVIAVVHRLDDDDDKLVVVSEGKSYSDEQILALVEFQESWFKPTIVRE